MSLERATQQGKSAWVTPELTNMSVEETLYGQKWHYYWHWKKKWWSGHDKEKDIIGQS
ncbi:MULTISPECIES: hypothetical protein [Halomonadaceae]|uniref:hypothetical protein n=1 Tax=Halomonadaceae TaxID=28256 RepID=UPI001597E303|nr:MULTISPECIES: hypothetical protein [Halomonas]QJQ94024.1 hypothetical protein HIO72_01065 [Halomonas sp. PA5]